MSVAFTPQAFVAKWRKAALKESAAAREHFLDLCQLIGHPTPAAADSEGTTFTFEYGAAKLGGGQGFTDVFKQRTLTNLCNQRPTWLDLAPKKLDAAVFGAYGWPADLTDEEILARLLALNLARAAAVPSS